MESYGTHVYTGGKSGLELQRKWELCACTLELASLSDLRVRLVKCQWSTLSSTYQKLIELWVSKDELLYVGTKRLFLYMPLDPDQ